MESQERFLWAADIMDVKSTDHILEIGCGVGFAVEKIALRLTQGKIVAIDRSAAMISKAMERNSVDIKAGKAEFVKTHLIEFHRDEACFNKIFCFNINFFWTNKSMAKEATAIKSLLTEKEGLLYIFYGPMVASGFNKIESPIRKNLEREKFKVRQILRERRLSCCCFIIANSDG